MLQNTHQEEILKTSLHLTKTLYETNHVLPVTPDTNDASASLKQLVGVFLKIASSKYENTASSSQNQFRINLQGWKDLG